MTNLIKESKSQAEIEKIIKNLVESNPELDSNQLSDHLLAKKLIVGPVKKYEWNDVT